MSKSAIQSRITRAIFDGEYQAAWKFNHESISPRVSIDNGGFDFIDAGSFAPNAVSSTNQLRYFLGQRVAGQLLRELPTSTPVDYYGATNCVAVSAHFGDGKTWENPDVSPSEPPLPTAPPTIPPN